MPKETKELKLKVKDQENTDQVINEVGSAINAIKENKIQNGHLQPSARIKIHDFTGKSLKIGKSIVIGGTQHFLKKGTQWDDVTPFLRKQLSFKDSDFE